ncbi:hypothetical protein [Fulvivirga sp.]|uniref:hypothetical protein n=2 Tax=Fulvivirga sp. TaxID=1931237 RepID=UPI0032ED8A65
MKMHNHLKIHQDHCRWESDLEMWSLDLKMWEEESEALNDTLSFITEAIKNHEESLMDHLKTLIDHRNKLNQHEKDITFLIEGTPLDDKLRESHTNEDKYHEIYRNAHERLKRYHHTLIALTKGLKKALESI